jgi:hypothetical protein
VIEASVEGADAGEEAVAEGGLVAGAEIADHAGLDLAHARVSGGE